MTRIIARETSVEFKCPGCGWTHMLNTGPGRPRWTFNGDLDRPTLSPSINHRQEFTAADRPARVCHSFVEDGRIRFLPDSTHQLAGQTVDLPEIGA